MKPVQIEIIPREQVEQLAHILGPSCAAAAVLRTLTAMGADADKFEICRNVKAQSLVLIEKHYLTDPRLQVSE